MKYIWSRDDKEFKELRDKLTNDGSVIHKDSFKCGDYYFTIRFVMLNKKIYRVKRCNKVCTEIVDISYLASYFKD